MATFPLGQFLSHFRNAWFAQRPAFVVPRSRFNVMVAHFLRSEGYVIGYTFLGSDHLRVFLSPLCSTARLRCELLSKPSFRRHLTAHALYSSHYFSTNVVAVSTVRGLRTAQGAVLENLGGECLFSLSLL